MNSTEIEFTIQRLDGETFSVNISRLEAGCYWKQTIESQYKNFGLDILKATICVQNGADPVNQQLFCEKELTIYHTISSERLGAQHHIPYLAKLSNMFGYDIIIVQ